LSLVYSDTGFCSTCCAAGLGLAGNNLIIVQRQTDGTVKAEVMDAVGKKVPLPHVVRHSPTGFQFGYAGSGPADLALSICWACCGKAAECAYRTYKAERLAPESGQGFVVKVDTVREHVQQIIKAQDAHAAGGE